MKKIITILLAVMLMASMTVTAQAVTPRLNIKVPQISSIKITPRIDYAGVVSAWLAEHPIKINLGG